MEKHKVCLEIGLDGQIGIFGGMATYPEWQRNNMAHLNLLIEGQSYNQQLTTADPEFSSKLTDSLVKAIGNSKFRFVHNTFAQQKASSLF